MSAHPPTILRGLHSILVYVLLFPYLQAVLSAPQSPEPSPQPCSYICPPLDKAGWRPVPQLDPSPTEIFCSYPTIANENPLDFYCIYSKVDAHLIYDHNVSFCQEYAVCSYAGRRSLRNAGRRGGMPKRDPLQPNPPADLRPSVMKTRVALGKEKKRPTPTV